MTNHCPTCGRPFKPQEPLLSPEARAEARRAKFAEGVFKRATQDLNLLRTRLREPFTLGDVGRALMREGRHYSECNAVIGRFLRLHWITLERYSRPSAPTRMFNRYRWDRTLG